MSNVLREAAEFDVEVGRFRFANPEMKEEELAAFFGLELAMMIVDPGPSQKE